jgi:hypothetical protein
MSVINEASAKLAGKIRRTERREQFMWDKGTQDIGGCQMKYYVGVYP